ncbi:ATPase [Clostridia bacterium]|nr:ATPase [Clostridia bacterium]
MNYYEKTAEEVSTLLKVDPSKGLTEEEAKTRLLQNGTNELAEQKKKSLLKMFLSQLNEAMIYILFAAAAISLFLGEFADAGIILFVVLLNSVIGAVQESKAQSSLDALKKMSSPNCAVRRGGVIIEIPAKELVTGDLVLLEAGRIVPADLRLTQTVNLKIEESALTGESLPSDKNAEAKVSEGAGAGDRINMAFSSTSVAYGRGEGIVVAAGMDTEIGKIAKMLTSEKEEMTPLQKRLAELGKILGIAAVLICGAMLLVGYLQQREMGDMLLTSIALAVAAIPEGLPAVVTIVLALGVGRMVKVNTIVRKLPSVETLGAVNVVCSDKTGTLTVNKMTVLKVFLDGQLMPLSEVKETGNEIFLRGFTLCNDASIQEGNRIGDPTELALLDMGAVYHLGRERLEEALPRINELAFDSDRKLMTTVHRETDGNILAFTKGAMDNILARSDKILVNGVTRAITAEDKASIEQAAKELAQDALRVLGLAVKQGDETATESNLTFVGLVGMIDPPREEAKDSVLNLAQAGIRTVMITGDHRDTALAIAKNLGIAAGEAECMTGAEITQIGQEELNRRVKDLHVFARVSPEHKVMIVKALQSHGYIVSMTGDGVNDAPSLKAANIGVAMGITGTDVAKGAADMVLTDDNFSSIEKAVSEGRTIYANIKKTVLFLLSSNLGEVFCMFAAIAAGFAAPLRATHILFVNLITDTLPALSLGVDPGSPNAMKQKPRGEKEGLFSNGGMAITVGYGLLIALLTLLAFLISPIRMVGFDLSAIRNWYENANQLELAQTYAFMTLAASQIFHSIGMRDVSRSIFRMDHLENRFMIIAVIIAFALQYALTEVGALASLFGIRTLGVSDWLTVLSLSVMPLVVHEVRVLLLFLLGRLKGNK